MLDSPGGGGGTAVFLGGFSGRHRYFGSVLLEGTVPECEARFRSTYMAHACRGGNPDRIIAILRAPLCIVCDTPFPLSLELVQNTTKVERRK